MYTPEKVTCDECGTDLSQKTWFSLDGKYLAPQVAHLHGHHFCSNKKCRDHFVADAIEKAEDAPAAGPETPQTISGEGQIKVLRQSAEQQYHEFGRQLESLLHMARDDAKRDTDRIVQDVRKHADEAESHIKNRRGAILSELDAIKEKLEMDADRIRVTMKGVLKDEFGQFDKKANARFTEFGCKLTDMTRRVMNGADGLNALYTEMREALSEGFFSLMLEHGIHANSEKANRLAARFRAELDEEWPLERCFGLEDRELTNLKPFTVRAALTKNEYQHLSLAWRLKDTLELANATVHIDGFEEVDDYGGQEKEPKYRYVSARFIPIEVKPKAAWVHEKRKVRQDYAEDEED